MRMLKGIALFFLTLFLGLQAVGLANSLAEDFFLPAEIEVLEADDDVKRADFPRGVRITHDGVFPAPADNHPPVLRFLIYNGSFEVLRCIGYLGKCAAPQIQRRESNIGSWECMNGSSIYTIKPGESAELMVTVQDFNMLPAKSDLVKIGYKFEYSEGPTYQYFAEPIVLPAEFRTSLKKYLKEVRDLEAGIY